MNQPRERAALVALIAESALEEGFNQPILSMEELESLRVGDLPEGSYVEVGNSRLEDGHTVITWHPGLTLVGERDGIGAEVEVELWPKYWYGSVGARQYLELCRLAVQARVNSEGDVHDLRVDDEDGVRISLRYTVGDITSDAPHDVARRALEVLESINDSVSVILAEVDRTLGRAAAAMARSAEPDLSELVQTVEKLPASASAHQKGRVLEDLLAAVFAEVEGFTVWGRNIRTETEEIDLTILNGSDDPVFRREGSLVLVEAKNWSAPVGRPELDSVVSKASNRGGRCTVAYLVAWTGVTTAFEDELLRSSREHLKVVPITGHQITEAIERGPGRAGEIIRAALVEALLR